MYIQQRRTSER